MKIRLVAALILLGVYVGGPLFLPEQHEAYAVLCYCDLYGDKYEFGESGEVYVGTDTVMNQLVLSTPDSAACTQRCWDWINSWKDNKCAANENLWYMTLTTVSHWSGQTGQIGPANVPCN